MENLINNTLLTTILSLFLIGSILGIVILGLKKRKLKKQYFYFLDNPNFKFDEVRYHKIKKWMNIFLAIFSVILVVVLIMLITFTAANVVFLAQNPQAGETPALPEIGPAPNPVG